MEKEKRMYRESGKINLYRQKYLRKAGHNVPFFRTTESSNKKLFFLFKNKIYPISSLIKFISQYLFSI